MWCSVEVDGSFLMLFRNVKSTGEVDTLCLHVQLPGSVVRCSGEVQGAVVRWSGVEQWHGAA